MLEKLSQFSVPEWQFVDDFSLNPDFLRMHLRLLFVQLHAAHEERLLHASAQDPGRLVSSFSRFSPRIKHVLKWAFTRRCGFFDLHVQCSRDYHLNIVGFTHCMSWINASTEKLDCFPSHALTLSC